MAESVYTNRSLDLLFRVLTLCGLFMPQSFVGTWKGVFYNIYSCFMVTGTLLIYLLSEIMDIIMNLGDLDRNIETSVFAISLFTVSMKTINTILKRQSIQNIRDMLDGPTFTTVSAEGSKHILKSMSIIQLSVKLFRFGTFGTIMFLSLFPIFDKSDENTLPSTAWLPWDQSEQTTYVILYLYQVTALGIITAFNSSQELITSSMMILAGGQLDVLRAELSALGTDLEPVVNGVDNERNECASHVVKEETEARRAAHVNDCLRTCIIRHKEIMKYAKEVEDAFSWPIFFQFLGNCVTICVAAFQMSQTRFSLEFMSQLFFMTTVTAELLLFCYPGNNIMLKSQLISTAAYECPWYNQGIAFRKKLMILMERSKRPIILRAGHVLPLTLETFTSILHSSYSFYAVLQSVHKT